MKEHHLEIPIFPIKGVILLPNLILPLNIFEKRYLNMVDDVLKNGSRLIGMVQPFFENSGNTIEYKNMIGCYGKIIKFEETERETYLISIKGFSRFCVDEVNLTNRGYICAKISSKNFIDDTKSNKTNFKFKNDKKLKVLLKNYLKLKQLDTNWDYINSCANVDLTNQLAMICPFSPHEKQMLLESNHLDDRYVLLVSILENTIKLSEEINESRH